MEKRRIVIVANGFFPFPIPMRHIAAAIGRHGFEPDIIPFDLRNKWDARAYAATIAYHARMAHRRSGRRVHVIGTSMGGIAGLYAIMFEGIAEIVHTFVAVGAPFDGSPVAAKFGRAAPLIGCLAAGQLTKGSRILEILKATPLPEGPRYISLGGLADRTCPPPTHELAGAENLLYRFSHRDIMFRSWMHEHIAEYILK